MHVTEMRSWIAEKAKRLSHVLMSALPEALRNGMVGQGLTKGLHGLWRLADTCFIGYDRFRFWLSYRAYGPTPIERETAKLEYSWRTFSDDYLKYQHGQDYCHPSRILARKMVQQLVNSHSGENGPLKLLDVPCGNGTDYEHIFSKLSLEYTGLELNPKQVKLNRERLPGGNFQVGNILDLDVADLSYDIVYCRHIFEHLSLDAMNIALQETYRVARRHLLYVFFSMEDIPEHQERPVRLYHWNVLSKNRVEERLRSFERVKDLRGMRISEVTDDEVVAAFKEPGQDNTVFLVTLRESL